MSEQVIVRREGAVGRLTLNRPKALHALNEAMCRALAEALLAWRADERVRLVILDHAGERGFCAGGDIRMVAESGYGDGRAAEAFFLAEYRLNHLLFTYEKPIVAFMDGVTMGGGVGLALPCRFRVASERTAFAMPETGIGLFPDVGTGWFLPRLPHHAGWWLALTGARLGAADCRLLGLATHVVEDDQLEAAKQALLEAVDPAALDRFSVEPDLPPLAERLDEIGEIFNAPDVPTVIRRLRAGSAWAREEAQGLAGKSPQAMKLTWRVLQRGSAAEDFAAVMQLDYRLAVRVVRRHDFQQGVRAVILAKDNDPRWYPPTLDATPDAVIESLFDPLTHIPEWTPH